ncbi:cytochrome c oxidase assembly protein [Streptomyces sp. NPDC094048]|uniref:cytochrome c oxidase assembly protein n=1 Tax=Streptomyces sp. NPDC094048 TaxID=3155207 RepID=UPI00331D88AD
MALPTVVVLGGLYVAGVVRRVRSGQRWSATRTLAFALLGLGMLVVATMSSLAVYDRVLFWPAAVQNILLDLLVPLGSGGARSGTRPPSWTRASTASSPPLPDPLRRTRPPTTEPDAPTPAPEAAPTSVAAGTPRAPERFRPWWETDQGEVGQRMRR